MHWFVHYLLCGIAANIDFEDQSSLLIKPGSENEHW